MKQSSPQVKKNPNCILITVDALRVSTLGCYGNQQKATPNLDRMAEDGLCFTQAFTAGSWTQAAFPALLTSTYPSTHGGCIGQLSPERPSPVEALAAGGYTTAGFATNPHVSEATGYDRGFNHFIDFIPGGKDPLLRKIKGGQFLLRKPLTHNVARWMGMNLQPRRVYSSASEVTSHLCNMIGSQDQPFFFWVHYMDVHWPYNQQQNKQTATEIARAWQDFAWMHRYSHGQGVKLPKSLIDRFEKLYYRSLVYLDMQIGRLLCWLDENDLTENTIVILTADHGEEFGDHGRWGHWESNLFDETLRVPLIVRWPAEVSIGVNDQLVRTVDIMPTVLDVSGIPPVKGMVGHSLRPSWSSSKSFMPAEVVIAEMPRPDWQRYAIRTAKHKLIWDSRKPEHPELYDLQTDPWERDNQAMTQPEILLDLKKRLDEHQEMVETHQSSNRATAMEYDEDLIRRLQDLGYLP